VTQALVTCIVPVFNGERFIAEALESILAQDYRPIEIVVVDDGSTDNTPDVVRGFGDRVRYFRQSNSGAPTARNCGLLLGRGEFLAFLDADDLWHREKLSRQMARFEARPELDLCITHLQRFWVAQLQTEQQRFEGHRFAERLPGYVTQTLLARHRLFDTVGPFDTSRRVGDPMDWFLRAAEQGAVMELLPDLLVYQRMHENNLSVETGTRRMKPIMQDSILHVIKASLDRRRAGTGAEPVPLKFPAMQRDQKS
jgi:glycosyltransferase involved in cell wall biosynthesis